MAHLACLLTAARRVDQQGIASFVAVEGSYAVRLTPAGKNKNPAWQDKLLVGAGQEVQVVLNK